MECTSSVFAWKLIIKKNSLAFERFDVTNVSGHVEERICAGRGATYGDCETDSLWRQSDSQHGATVQYRAKILLDRNLRFGDIPLKKKRSTPIAMPKDRQNINKYSLNQKRDCLTIFSQTYSTVYIIPKVGTCFFRILILICTHAGRRPDFFYQQLKVMQYFLRLDNIYAIYTWHLILNVISITHFKVAYEFRTYLKDFPFKLR